MARPQPGGRPSAKLQRGYGHRELLPKILVACEGKTEKTILEALRASWRIPCLQVIVVGQVGVPRTVVNRAKAERSGFDEVWVAFDRDEHPCWQQAIQQALANKFKLAVSNPCIELWGILLHRDQTAHIERDSAQRDLRELHPKYHHDRNPFFDRDTVLSHLDDAFERAERLLKSFEVKTDPYRCPTTRFHHLIARLKTLGDNSG